MMQLQPHHYPISQATPKWLVALVTVAKYIICNNIYLRDVHTTWHTPCEYQTCMLVNIVECLDMSCHNISKKGNVSRFSQNIIITSAIHNDSMSILGVMLQSDCKFILHVEEKLGEVNKRLYMIKSPYYCSQESEILYMYTQDVVDHLCFVKDHLWPRSQADSVLHNHMFS